MDNAKSKSRPLSDLLLRRTPSESHPMTPKQRCSLSEGDIRRLLVITCNKTDSSLSVNNVTKQVHVAPFTIDIEQCIYQNNTDLPHIVHNNSFHSEAQETLYLPSIEHSFYTSFKSSEFNYLHSGNVFDGDLFQKRSHVPSTDLMCPENDALKCTSLLREHQPRPFYGRKWVFDEILQYIKDAEHFESDQDFDSTEVYPENRRLDFVKQKSRPNLERLHPVLLVGGHGAGKTSLCRTMLNVDNQITELPSSCAQLNSRILYAHFSCNQIAATLDPIKFVFRLHQSLISSRTIIGDYYRKSFSSTKCKSEVDNIYTTADDILVKGVLAALNKLDYHQVCSAEVDTNTRFQPVLHYVILLDGIDQPDCVVRSNAQCLSLTSCNRKEMKPSQSIVELLVNSFEYFPRWLTLVITCLRRNRDIVQKLFPGSKEICLDDLHKSAVCHDMQQYVFHRLATEKTLQHAFHDHMHSTTLSLLRIKSSGCILYLETLLDAIREFWISPEQLNDIPGTLNGMFLWLCQYFFIFRRQDIHKNVFSVVRPLLELLLALPCTVTEQQLYRISKARNVVMQPSTYYNHLRLLKPFLVTMTLEEEEYYYGSPCNSNLMEKQLNMATLRKVHFFHPSFAEWLLDVKHCTREFLCAKDQDNIFSFIDILDEISLAREDYNVEESGCELNITTEKSTIHERSTASIENMGQMDESGYSCPSRNSAESLGASGKSLSSRTHKEQGPGSLVLATRKGNLDAVSSLLASGANANELDEDGWSSLRTAAWHGYSEIVDLLLDSGADVNLAGSDGRTALRAAAWGGHEQVVQRLLQAGADVDIQDAEGRSPLIAAAYMGHVSIVEILARAGADLNHSDEDGRTALHVAAFSVRPSEKHHEVVATLLDYGANPTVFDSEGITPLLGAARVGNRRICELCLEADTDVNQMDKYGNSALSLAILGGHADVVRLLLFWGSAVDLMDSAGRSLLSLAAALGNSTIVCELLARGLDEAHRDHGGRTPLHLAAAGFQSALMLDCETAATKEQYCEVIRILIESGARVDAVDNEGRTPLLTACECLETEAVKLLLSYESPGSNSYYNFCRAKKVGNLTETEVLPPTSQDSYEMGNDVPTNLINQPSLNHQTPLRAAVLANNSELVRILLAAGADPDHQDAYGRTALYLLALDGAIDMADLLLHTPAPGAHARRGSAAVVGANPVLADDEGRCPLHVATWQGHLAMVRLLLQAGTPADIRDREGRTPLQLAAWQGHAAICHVLLKEGNARVDAACSQGATSLCIAAQEGHIENGANPFQADDHGRTPFLVALKAGHHEVCRLLAPGISMENTEWSDSLGDSVVSTETLKDFECRPPPNELPTEYASKYDAVGQREPGRSVPVSATLQTDCQSSIVYQSYGVVNSSSEMSSNYRSQLAVLQDSNPYAKPSGPLLSVRPTSNTRNVSELNWDGHCAAGSPVAAISHVFSHAPSKSNFSQPAGHISKSNITDPTMHHVCALQNSSLAPVWVVSTNEPTAAFLSSHATRHILPDETWSNVPIRTPVMARSNIPYSSIRPELQVDYRPSLMLQPESSAASDSKSQKLRPPQDAHPTHLIHSRGHMTPQLPQASTRSQRGTCVHPAGYLPDLVSHQAVLQSYPHEPVSHKTHSRADPEYGNENPRKHVSNDPRSILANPDNEHAIVSPFKRREKLKGHMNDMERKSSSHSSQISQGGPVSYSQPKTSSAKSTLASVFGLGCNRVKRSSPKEDINANFQAETESKSASSHSSRQNWSMDSDNVCNKTKSALPANNRLKFTVTSKKSARHADQSTTRITQHALPPTNPCIQPGDSNVLISQRSMAKGLACCSANKGFVIHDERAELQAPVSGLRTQYKTNQG